MLFSAPFPGWYLDILEWMTTRDKHIQEVAWKPSFSTDVAKESQYITTRPNKRSSLPHHDQLTCLCIEFECQLKSFRLFYNLPFCARTWSIWITFERETAVDIPIHKFSLVTSNISHLNGEFCSSANTQLLRKLEIDKLVKSLHLRKSYLKIYTIFIFKIRFFGKNKVKMIRLCD